MPTPTPPPSGLAERLLDRLTWIVTRQRGLVLLGLIVLTVAAAWVGRRIRTDFSVQELFARSDPEIDYLREFKARFGADDDLLVILVADDRGVVRPEVLRQIDRLTRAARRLPRVQRVQSLTTLSDLGQTDEGAIDARPLFATIPEAGPSLEALRRRALGSPLLAGRILARDGTLTAVVLKLRDGTESALALQESCDAVERLLAKHPPPPGVRQHLLGIPFVRAEAARMVRNDQLRFLPLGCVLTTLFLLLVYRRPSEIVIPLVSVALSAGYTVSLMALLEAPIDILSNVLPLLVMVYGVADAVHLLARIDEETRAGRAREEAIRVAMRQLGVACLLTSATTAAGFASLWTGELRILRRFGSYAGAGVLIAYLVAILVTPLGASFTRSRSRPRRPGLPGLDRVLARCAGLAIRRPRTILLGYLGLATAALLLGSRVKVDNFLLGIYRDDHPTAVATRLAERKLDGVVTLQVSLQGKPGALKDPRVLRAAAVLQRWLETQDGVTSSISLASFVRELHRVVAGRASIPDEGVAQLLLMAEGEDEVSRYADYSFARGRIVVSLEDIGARRYLALAAETARQLPDRFGSLGIEARVTGTSLVAYKGINRLVYDMLWSVGTAFLIVAGLLALAFRSIRTGLISLIPNVLPLAVGLGFMPLAGMKLEPSTVVIFSIAFGIAVDDTIHGFARYREEVLERERSVEDAVRATLASAGRPMVFTSLTLIAGFSVTLLSNFPATSRFGVLGIVILATALGADLLVTPACLLVFRPWSGRQRRS